MTLVRRTRELRDPYAIFDFECESCGLGYTEADDSEPNAVRRESLSAHS